MKEIPDSPVMVLSAAAGAGHVRAAEALLQAFRHKNVSALHLEVLQYTNSVFRKMYSDLYVELINRRPELLGWVYNYLDQPWRYQKRKLALNRLNTGSLAKLFKREQPAIALCTHFLPAEIILHLRRKKYLDMPVGIVITDFDAHALWLFRDVDWYFVACEETKIYLSEIGIPADSIYITGIPIDPVFTTRHPKRETRSALGLDQDKTTILISAGGFGVGPVEIIVKAIQKVKHPVQVVVVCGRNEELRDRLMGISDTEYSLKVIGYTNEMNRWMAASDLLVGKPGGLTTSEALASGLIMVIVNPVPGQEERNSDHLLEEGAAIRCNNLPVLARKIDILLEDSERFQNMQDAVQRLAHPDAASDIVSIVMNDRAEKHVSLNASGTE